MTAYYCVWVDGSAWRALRSAKSSAEAEVSLGEALKGVCTLPSLPRSDAGVLHLPSLEHIVPSLMQGRRPHYVHWSHRTLQLEEEAGLDLEYVREYGTVDDTNGEILLLSVDADAIEWVDPASIGRAVYLLLDSPHESMAPAGEMSVLRGATVAADDDLYLVFFHDVARDPGRLSPAEEAELRRSVKQPRAASSRPAQGSGKLVPHAVRVTGPGVGEDEASVLLSRNHTAVLFGRNGAGKTMLLNVIQRTLDDPVGTTGLRISQAGPRASVLLGTAEQRYASREFALLLAHLAFQPLSDLPAKARALSGLPVRGWDAFEPFDAGANALTVSDLLDQPLPVLQDTLTVMLTHVLSAVSPDMKDLAHFIATSSGIEVAPGGWISLSIDTALAGDAVRVAAQRYVADAPLGNGLSPLLYRVYRAAEAVITATSSSPLPVLSVQLAQAAEGVAVHPDAGWLQAGEELERLLRKVLPCPVAYAMGQQGSVDLELAVEEAVVDLTTALTGAPENDEHIFASRPELSERVLVIFEEELSALLPRFIRDSGHVRLALAPLAMWHRRRIIAGFVRHDTQQSISLGALPTGYATWIHAAMTFARARLLVASWGGQGYFGAFSCRLDDDRVDMGSVRMAVNSAFEQADASSITVQSRENRLLYLIDEPESHLHLTAQRDVVDVMKMLSADSAGVVVATHALAFLDVPPGATTVYTLVGDYGHVSVSHGASLSSIISRAGQLGIPASAMAQLYRGVLLVEGINDVEVLRRYGDVDLDEARVLVLPLQGHSGAVNLADAEFLHTLRIPTFLLLDHVRRSVLIAALNGTGRQQLHTEERTLLALHGSLSKARLRLRVLPFAGQDIVVAVPEDDIAKLLKRHGAGQFVGWKRIRTAAEEAWKRDKTRFKEVFLRETGVQVDRLLRDLRESESGFTGRSPGLHGVLTSMLDAIASPEHADGHGLEVLKRST